MTKVQKTYQRLVELARQVKAFESIAALLDWDQQTQMPAAGAEWRAEQTGVLAGETHRRLTDPEWLELFAELADGEQAHDPHGVMGANIRELKRRFDQQARMPRNLVEQIARTCSHGQQVWVEARQKNDFQLFAPTLKEIFRLKREQAQTIGDTDDPYDALLDEFEPYARTDEVARLLDGLKQDLLPLLPSVEIENRSDDSILRRSYPEDRQREFARWASTCIGFDYDRGRLDIAPHPFCLELGPDDVRLTTRYDEHYFSSAFFGTLHEAGHGIYEQQLPSDQYGLPAGRYCSLGVHESQSRLWENAVGRSRGFWQFAFARAQQHFSCLADVTLDEFHAAVNRVEPSLIRVEADEVTYNLHIIIRFELERALLAGELEVDDLPVAWNERYQQLLGVHPDDDAVGVLQDVHWSIGVIGYFPTYTLGNLFAAQLIEAAERDLGDLNEMFSEGEFSPLRKWLGDKIFQWGARHRSTELVEMASGQPLDHAPLVRQLQEKLQTSRLN